MQLLHSETVLIQWNILCIVYIINLGIVTVLIYNKLQMCQYRTEKGQNCGQCWEGHFGKVSGYRLPRLKSYK